MNKYTNKDYNKSELEQKITTYTEKYRPQYHYSPKENWVNDPNGLVYYEGIWHLYYQYNPTNNLNNSNTHWGHATSSDLINWVEQPIALFPDDLGNMWSGTGVVDENNTSGFFSDTKEKKGIVVAYSTNSQHIGIAYSKDGGYTFKKISTNTPVLPHPKDVLDFRDPHIFWYEKDQKWKMIVAGGLVRIYESSNLIDWSHCSDTIYNTECPNLVKMYIKGTNSEKWLLSLGGRKYVVGSFDGKEFINETEELIMNYGPDAYAGITFSNAPNKRIIMLSWLNNWAYTCKPDGIWNGCFTIPVEFELIRVDNSYKLIQTPIEELKSLRKEKIIDINDVDYLNNTNPLRNIETNCFEMNLEIDLFKTDDFEINLCVGDGEKTTIRYFKELSKFVFLRCDSKYGISEIKKDNFLYEIPISKTDIKNNLLKLRIFVDISNIEIFINEGHYYFVARIQPFSSSKKMNIMYDKKLCIKNLQIYTIESIHFKDEEVMSPHISIDDDLNLKINQVIEIDVYSFNINCFVPIKIVSSNQEIVNFRLVNDLLIIEALNKGETELKIMCGKYYISRKCIVT